MRIKNGVGCLAFCGMALGQLFAQTEPKPLFAELRPGIVIESVAANSMAQKMGFEPGNVILGWQRGERHGLIESPLDLLDVEIEELPLGPVTLQGAAGTAGKTWSWTENTAPEAKDGAWGLTTRPNFSGSLLAAHQAALEEAKSNSSTAASGHWQEAAQETQNLHLPPWLTGWFLLRAAESLVYGKDTKSADRTCRQAVALVHGDGFAEVYKLLRGCGDLMLQQHAEEQAQSYYQQALEEIQRSTAMSMRSASILAILGRMASANDDYARGEALVVQALKIQEQLAPESAVFAASLNQIGVLMQSTGELDESKAYLLHAIALREKLAPESVTLARVLENLGNTLDMRGDLDQSESYLLRALQVYEHLIPDTLQLAGCLVNLSNTAESRGEFGKAEEYLRRALAIQKRLRPRGRGVAVSLNNLGGVMQDRGEFAAAENYFRQALALKEELHADSEDIAITLTNIGMALRDSGDLLKSKEYLLRALQIRLKVTPKSKETAGVYTELGTLALGRQELADAEDYYRKALAVAEAATPNGSEVSDALQGLGDVAAKKGNAEQAETYYLRALGVRKRLSQSSAQYAETLIALGEVAQGSQRWETAELWFRQALEALERQTAQLGGAEEVQAGFRATHSKYYHEYIDLLVRENKLAPALDVLERSRARTLLETLATAHVDLRRGVDPEVIRKERSLQADMRAKSERRVELLAEKESEKQVNAVEKEISKLSSEFQDVESQIRSSSPAYAALVQPQPLSAKEIQEQILDPDTLLLEYSLGEARSYVVVVSTSSLEAFALPKRAVIEAASRRMYELLTARNRRSPGEKPADRAARIAHAEAEYPAAAAKLSRLVLGPIATKLAGKRLLIVSDGALHYVPFAALPTQARSGRRVPLVAHHEIVSLPSASVLAILRRERLGRSPAAKTVAVMADPVFDRGDVRVKRAAPYALPTDSEIRSSDGKSRAAAAPQEKTQAPAGLEFNDGEESLELAHFTRSAADIGWEQGRRGEVYLPRLQFSRREADAIVTVTPAGQSLVALDFKANRTTATSSELANYRIVHFATHALLNSKHPELSGLVLSLVDEHGRTQSGFLGLEDIYNLNLPAELVVLSACETALGKGIEGEGMVGLTRGFMYAGASRVIASLWNIDDRATADQMKYFYRAMVGQGMRPAAALRAAQLKMRRDPRWSSPYFWAAFQIQGEWK